MEDSAASCQLIANMTRIKICGLTRIEDALAAARSGADAIGLVFHEKSPRYVTQQQAARLAQALPPFVSVVGLFVDVSADYVHAVLEEVPLDSLQFHGEETPDFCASFGRPYIKAIRVRPGVDLVQCASAYASAQGLLLDAWVQGIPGGTGHAFDWGLIPPPDAPNSLPLPVILSGGLHPGNVAQAIRAVRPYAVDVSSGVEAGKGIKDAAKIAAFIKEVKDVDVQLSR